MAEIAALGLRVDGARNIDQASKSLDDFTRSGEKAERSTGGLATGSKKATREVKATGEASAKSSTSLNSLAGAARLAAGALATVGASVGLTQSIRQIGDFQAAMNGLSAVSGATADQISQLESQARTLGATSMFSAQQAAEGQRFLAQAGFEVNEILSATPGILRLATAGELDLASAADIASNVLGGMRLEVDQLNRVNDVLAATAARSNTSIQQLGQALSFAAPFAAGAGVSIEEAASAIGTMSDAGIQASRAGTGLVGVIRQLSNVTSSGEEVLSKYGLSLEEVSIESRGLGPVLDTLRKANLNTAAAIALFGSEAGAAAQVLVQDYKGAIEGATGEADRMAAQLEQGLKPAFLSLSSAASESILQLGDSGLAGSLESLVRSATGVISVWNGMLSEFADANGITKEQADRLESVATGLEVVGTTAVIAIGGKLAGAAATAGTSMALAATQGVRLEMQLAGVLGMSRAAAGGLYTLAAAGRAATGALAFIGGPVGLAVIAAGSLYYFRDALFDTSRELTETEKNVKALADRMGDLTKAEVLHERTGLERQLRANAEALRAAREEAERLKKEQSDSAASSAFGIGSISKLNEWKEASQLVADLNANEKALAGQIGELDEKLKSLTETTDNTSGSTKTLAAQAAKLASSYKSLIQELDPARASLTKYFDTLDEIEKLGLGERETKRLNKLALEQYEKRMEGMVDASKDAAKESAKAFENPWQETADSVAQSLQDAIASGDWEGLADGIGNTLSTVLAGSVNAAITEAVGAAGMGAFAGPIGGAIAGGLLQSALSGSSYVDPTAARQESQLTGTVLGSIDEKSSSIVAATEMTADATSELVNVNRDLVSLLSGTNQAAQQFGTTAGSAISSIVDTRMFRKIGEDAGLIVAGTFGDAVVSGFADFSAIGQELTASALNDELSDSLTAGISSIIDTVISGSESLGVATEGLRSRLEGAALDIGKISFEDMDSGEIADTVNELFSSIFDTATLSAAPDIAEFQRLGEGAGETLTRLVTQLGVFDEALLTLDMALDGDGVAVADKLAQLAGGAGQLASQLRGFESNFLSESEQAANATRRLTDAMGELPIPETRAGYLELVRAQDLATEAGQRNYTTLLSLQAEADEYYSRLEDGSAQAIEDAANLAAELSAAFRSATDSALSSLQRSVSAELQAAQEQYDMRMQANRLATDAAQAGLQYIRSEVQAIQGATGQLEGQYDPIQSMLRATALESVRMALRTGDLSGVGEAAGIAAAVSESGFATKEAYEVEQAKTLNLLSQLEDSGEDQITTAERSLRALEDQADTIKRGFDQEQARLTDILANAQAQVDALRGIDNNTLGLAEAISALADALNLERPNAIAQAYSSAGQNLDSEGEAYWNQSIKSGSATTADLEFALWAANKENRDWFEATTGRPVPGYANGGMFGGGVRLVGERGPELEFTGSSRIMSNDDLMGSLGASKDMLNEMRALHRDFMRGLDVIARNTNKSSKQLERWDLTGLPQERDLV